MSTHDIAIVTAYSHPFFTKGAIEEDEPSPAVLLGRTEDGSWRVSFLTGIGTWYEAPVEHVRPATAEERARYERGAFVGPGGAVWRLTAEDWWCGGEVTQEEKRP